MNAFFKQSIAIIGIILAILSIYFGSYLPLVKSRRFITALGSASSVKTINDFQKNFDNAFKFYSPVGDEEMAKFLSSDILRAISQKEQSEAASRALVNYIEPYMFKNNVRHLIVLGQMYFVLWQKSGKEEDFKKAEEYYLKALAIGSKLPPVLYGLFDLERAAGNNEKAKEIGEKILKYWPEDERVRRLMTNNK
jgi:tetratricopeptide (TPR) repeat protein